MPKALTAKAVENIRLDPNQRLEIPDGLLFVAGGKLLWVGFRMGGYL
jgi:hypothetical protein